MNNNYILGLDLGIGSVGWALLSQETGKERIIDFGVRLFDSGEIKDGAKRKSQTRRSARSAKRLIRRRSHKKDRLKKHFALIKFTTLDKIQAYYETTHTSPYMLRTKALDEKLTPEELVAALIHICNHRGYKEFSDIDDTDDIAEEYIEDTENMSAEEKKAVEESREELENFRKIFAESGYRTVGEMYYKDEHFTEFKHNKNARPEHYLPSRRDIRKETKMILQKQAEYYPILNADDCIEKVDAIIFSQRDFEDGPGNPSPAADESMRRYKGFLDTIGKCLFYKDEDRGFRGTVLADVYAAVNVLSQNVYIDKSNPDAIPSINLPSEVAKELIDHLLNNANITQTNVKNICKKHKVEVQKNSNNSKKDTSLGNNIKFLKSIRKSIEKSGLKWEEFISEEQFDITKPSKLHLLGEVLSKYQTPKRKRDELKKLDFMTPELLKNVMGLHISGTSNVSYKFMIDATKAFLNGESYGNFQARKFKEFDKEQPSELHYKLPVLQDEYITKNPVVFRCINETRKVINAVINRYGSPSIINVEVASEVNRSYEEREKIKKIQHNNKKNNEKIKSEIIELGYDEDSVTQTMIDKYKLYQQQGGKCLYSDESIDLKACLGGSSSYEIDHIIPYSLILDNTLNNKALVLSKENQAKRQRTPLQYMGKEQAAEFQGRINELYKKHSISERKYEYLMLPNIYDEKCLNIINEWKSRNINDTRYITKYIIAYLKNNLKFKGETKVYGVKGVYTSKFRRIWLNKNTWGKDEKDREESNLHHAVDAVIIANLTPKYLEIASDNIKLYQMLKRNNWKKSDEYNEYLDKSVEKMVKYPYYMSEKDVQTMLENVKNVPSIVPNLRTEVDIRFNDSDEEKFRKEVKEYYKDESFSDLLRMPLVSYKQVQKLQGQLTDENPIAVRYSDGKENETKRKPVGTLNKKSLDKLFTQDSDLLDSLHAVLDDKSDKYTVADYLKELGADFFTTQKGKKVYKVRVLDKEASGFYRKDISANNYSMLNVNKYYCVEIYEDEKGKTCTRGIRRIDVTKKNKKLYLTVPNPEGYKQHIMYLFKGDYIVIKDKNDKIKFEGFYKSVANINENRFYVQRSNKPFNSNKDKIIISKTDKTEKYSVDILGYIGGKMKCGEPLSLI